MKGRKGRAALRLSCGKRQAHQLGERQEKPSRPESTTVVAATQASPPPTCRRPESRADVWGGAERLGRGEAGPGGGHSLVAASCYGPV